MFGCWSSARQNTNLPTDGEICPITGGLPTMLSVFSDWSFGQVGRRLRRNRRGKTETDRRELLRIGSYDEANREGLIEDNLSCTSVGLTSGETNSGKLGVVTDQKSIHLIEEI